MKKVIIILTIVLAGGIATRAQTPVHPTQQNYTPYYLYLNYLGVDKGFLLPQGDTTWLPARPALIYQSSDSSVYYWNWSKWQKLGSSIKESADSLHLLKTAFIDSLNNNRQQLTKVGDSVYLTFGGVVNVAPDSSVYVTRYYLSQQGYITSESDPVFTSSPAYNITTTNINDWQSAFKTAVYNPTTDTLTLTSVNGAPTKIWMVAIANTDTVETITQLQAYGGGSYILFLASTSNGGIFYKSDDDLTANNSTIYNAQDGNYWVKIASSGGAGTLSDVTHVGNVTDSSIYIRNGADSVHLGNNGDVIISGKIVAAQGGFNSDRRLKNILSIPPTQVIKKLHPVMYRWKKGKGDTILHIGYIAQDVERFMPNAVINRPDGYKALDYTEIHTAAINDLYGMLKKQKKEIEFLKSEIEKLKNK